MNLYRASWCMCLVNMHKDTPWLVSATLKPRNGLQRCSEEQELIDGASQGPTSHLSCQLCSDLSHSQGHGGSEDHWYPGQGTRQQKLPVDTWLHSRSGLYSAHVDSAAGNSWRGDFLRYRPCCFIYIFMRYTRYNPSNDLGLSVSYCWETNHLKI